MVEMENRKSSNNTLSESLKKKKQNTRTELILKTVIQGNFLEVKENLNLHIKRTY